MYDTIFFKDPKIRNFPQPQFASSVCLSQVSLSLFSLYWVFSFVCLFVRRGRQSGRVPMASGCNFPTSISLPGEQWINYAGVFSGWNIYVRIYVFLGGDLWTHNKCKKSRAVVAGK